MSEAVDIDLYDDDLEQDFAQEFKSDPADLYDDVIAGSTEGPSVISGPTAINDQSSTINGPTNTSSARRFQLYVGNLTWWTNDKDVVDAIQSVGVGDCLDVKFFENRTNGQSKGFCLITLGSEGSLRTCIDRLPKKDIHGQLPAVTYPTKQALSQFEAQSKTRPAPPPPPPVQRPPVPQPQGQQSLLHNNGLQLPLMIPQQQQQQSHQQHPQQQQHNHQPPPQQVQQQVRARMQLSGGMRPGSHPLQGGPPPPRMPNGPHQLLPPGMPNGPMQNQMPPNFQGPPRPGMLQPPPQGMPPQGMPPPNRGPIPPNMQFQGPPHQMQGMPPRGPPPGPQPMMNNDPRAIRPDWNRPPGHNMQPGGHMYGAHHQQGPHHQVMMPGQGPPMHRAPAPGQMSGPVPGMPPVSQHAPVHGPPQINNSAPQYFPQGGPPSQNTGPPPPHLSHVAPPPNYAQPASRPPQYQAPDNREHHIGVNEQEFEEIMNRNRTVSSSAITRAVADAAAGEYASAVETLMTAITLIKQSKVAGDDRCKILITSLQDTLHGIEQKSYRHGRRDRSRSHDRERSHRRSRRERSHSRERDYRDRRDKDRYYSDTYLRERTRSRDRERDRERDYNRDRSREDSSTRGSTRTRVKSSPDTADAAPATVSSSKSSSSRYYEDRYRERDRDRERDRGGDNRDRDSRHVERERDRDRREERGDSSHRSSRH